MEPKMCSVTTERFISFSASPICFGSAAQFSRKEKKKKKKNRLLRQTKLGLNSRLILKNLLLGWYYRTHVTDNGLEANGLAM